MMMINEAESTLTLKARTNIPNDTTLTIDFRSASLFGAFGLVDYTYNPAGTPAEKAVSAVGNETDTATKFEEKSYMLDDDKPVIEYVEAIDNQTLKVVFNEEISSSYRGSYKVYNGSTAVSGVSTSTAQWSSSEKNAVKVTITGTLTENEAYVLRVTGAARDIAGNAVADINDLKFDFVQSPIKKQDYIQGVEIVDTKTVKVRTTKAIDIDATDIIQLMDGTTVVRTVSSSAVADPASTKVVVINLNEALLDGKTYKATVDGMTYSFTGIAKDGGLSVDTTNPAAATITFSGIDMANYVVKVVYNGNPYVVDPVEADDTLFTFNLNNINGAGMVVGVGSNYVVEVYRALTPATFADTAPYARLTKATAEDAVLYSKEFTR